MEINNNGTIIKVYPSDESELTTGVMISGKVVLHFRSDKDIKLEQGAAIEFLGNTYTLIYPQETKKLWRGYFEYIATFYSSAEQLKHKLLKDPSNIARTSFVFAGSPTDFATLIARSMGREWSVGNCVATLYDKTIAFKEESCWAALGRVAEEFHTEWVVEGKSISLRKDERYKEDPLPLSYGKGNGFLSGVSQRGNADNLPISRLYVLGSSRNIDPTKYRASTLHLPKSWSREGMRTDEAGNYIELLEGNGAEGAMELSDLYPHRVGVVSSVVVVNEAKHFYDIIDSSIPEELNYNDYRIRGEKATLKFETGALAGHQFEIRQSETALSGYHHQERRFELIPSEQDGFIMPSKEWAPKAGDKYAIFGIALPQEYVARAENELLKEAIRTLSERSLPQFTFEGEVDGIWAKRKWLEIGGKLVPGGHVLFSDPEFHPEGTVIRITSMAQKVNNPTAPSITLSTALVGGSLWNLLNRAEAQEVLSQKRDQELQRSQRQSYEQALEHIEMVSNAVEGLEGFTKRIKPSVIETMGLLVGSQATQFDFVDRIGSLQSTPPTINYDPTTKRVTITNTVLRHQTIGITGITNSRKPSDYRYWSLSKYESPALTEEQESYYIYARVAKEGNTGVCLLSKTPIGMEEVSGHYHLLIGTLSSIIDNDRAYHRLYGYSMISPGQMVTDKIESANGRMRIDLATGEILSDRITFRRPDGTRGNLTEAIDTIQKTPGPKGDKGEDGKDGLPGAPGKDAQNVRPNILRARDIVNRGGLTYDEQKKAYIIHPHDKGWMILGASNGDIIAGKSLVYSYTLRNKSDVGYDVAHPFNRRADGRSLNDLIKPGEIVRIYMHRTDNYSNFILNNDKAFAPTKGYIEVSEFKVEEVEDGGLPIPTAYLPHPDDLIGKDGISINLVDVEYAVNTSAATPPTSGWTTSAPTISGSQQLWTRTKTTYSSGSPTYTKPANITPQKGDTGKSIDSVTEEYAISTSKTTQPTSGWSETQPQWEQGKYIWSRSKIVYKNPASTTYTGYSCSSEWEAINSIQIGGRNLALLTATPCRATGRDSQAGDLDLVKETAYRLSEAPVVGETYTLSFEGRAEGNIRLFIPYLSGTQRLGEVPLTTEWKRYSVTFRADCAYDVLHFYGYGIRLLEIRRLKLERGTVATDWTQAPEDLQAEIDNVGAGTQNYCPSDVVKTDKNRAIWRLRLADGFFHAVPVGVEVPINIGYDVYFDNDRTDNEVKTTIFYTDQKDNYKDGSRRHIIVSATSGLKGRTWHHIWERGKVARLDKHVRIMGWLADTSKIGTYPSEVRNVYLRVGGKDLGWTPAPEDVQAEIDAINANPPRINDKGTWEVYVPSQGKYIDTGRTSVGDDGKAPKILNGNWHEWNGTKYTDTGIKALGRDGRDATPVRENLFSAKLYTFEPNDAYGAKCTHLGDGRWRVEKVAKSQRSYFEGASFYVHPIRDTKPGRYTISCRIVETSKTIRHSYNTAISKHGHPVGSRYMTVIDSKDGRLPGLGFFWGETATKGNDIGDYTIIDHIKVERVEEGEDPHPTAYLPHPLDLKGEDADPRELAELKSGLSNANTALATLEDLTKKLEDGMVKEKDIPDIKWLLDAYNNGKTTVAGGLVLTKIIALSNQVDRITAYLSGYDGNNGDGKILRAGIKYDAKERREKTGTEHVKVPLVDALEEYWNTDAQVDGFAKFYRKKYPTGPNFETLRSQNKAGLDQWLSEGFPNGLAMNSEMLKKIGKKPDFSMDLSAALVKDMYVEYTTDVYTVIPGEDLGTEQVAIRHDGTGHFGDIHFGGDRIDYIDQATGEAYLSVGNVVNESIQDVVRKNSVDRTVTLSSASGIREGNVSMVGRFTIENDNTRVFLQYDIAVGYDRDAPIGRKHGGYAEMRIKNTSRPNAEPWIIIAPAQGNTGGARYGTCSETKVNMQAGEYVVEVRSIGPYTSTGYRNFTVRQVYISALKQSFITPRGIRFYGSPQKFVDFDYYGTPALKMKGGLKADYIDTPGMPLAGATFNDSGGEEKALGKYKNRSGGDKASAYYDYSTKSFTVYHSIPHDNYIPLVTPFGTMGNNENWNLAVRVYEVKAYSFTMKLLTNRDNPTQNGFSYVAFQAG